MNFEQLFKKKKNRKFFLFHVENIIFYDMVLFQNISLKITDTSFQSDSTFFLYSNSLKSSYTLIDFFLILLILFFFYYVFFEFLNLWYEKNMTFSNTKIFNDFLVNLLLKNNFNKSSLFLVSNFFNLNITEFLDYYNY